MNLAKSREFFDPSKVDKTCHVIGCGSIGSNVAELLARYGIKNITLWDFDRVEPHNIANQLYTQKQVGELKVVALTEILKDINPDINLKTVMSGYKNNEQSLNGHVFMCLDNIDVRNQIVDDHWYNGQIETITDFRTTLLEGQSYFAKWNSMTDKQSLKKSMDFTHEEASENTPVSACGFELSVSPVVKLTAIMGICNFTNYINGHETHKLMLTAPYNFHLEAY